MKVAITLLVVGIAGLGQYIYFQLTPLACTYTYYELDNVVHVIANRDWTVGLIGAVIGVVLLASGIYRYKRSRHPATVRPA